MTAVHVLIVDDSPDDAFLIVRQLAQAGLDVAHTRADSAGGVEQALAEHIPDVVICDYNMPGFRAEFALQQVQACEPDIPFLLVSGEVGEEVATALMRAGARDFVLKDRLTLLAPAVQRELREAADRRQRRAAEAALRESEERFRLLAEHAQDIIFRYRTRPEPAVEYVSPAIASMLGCHPGEILADPDLLFRLAEPDDEAALRMSWLSGSPGTLVVRWRHPDGRVVSTEQRAVAITDEAGRVTAVEGILRDITEQVTAAGERTRLEQQLRQAERLDSLGQLAGGIAHDFNNLLAVIAGYAEVLIEDAGPEFRAELEGIKHAADRGGALTRQLLIFSRLEPSQPELLDLNAVVIDLQRLFERTLGEDIDITVDLEPGLPPVTMDRSKLDQVLLNAVMNSRAAMPAGGQLLIVSHAGADLSTGGRTVCLTVTDTGAGMPPDVAARAFEPFFTTKGRGRGTGLGLATAYGAVTEAGGTITLDSREGHGTTLKVTFPAGTGTAAPPDPGAPAGAGGNGERILVVEDEDAVRDIVGRILGKAGYQVRSAPDPNRALALFHADPDAVDALLTDVIMPGMSGTQLAARLRRERPGLPVLFMSGYTSGPAPGGQELPPDAPLIRKPFQTATLLRELSALLSTDRTRITPAGAPGAAARPGA